MRSPSALGSPRGCAADLRVCCLPAARQAGIADFQSAACGHFGRYGIDASPADWKSATQQTGSLQYALARTCERLANSARSWSAVALYRFSPARDLGVSQSLVGDVVSALPKRQRTGALHDAVAPHKCPFSLTSRFSGVMGGRERTSTVLTVSSLAQSKRFGKSARLCRRPPSLLPARRQAGGYRRLPVGSARAFRCLGGGRPPIAVAPTGLRGLRWAQSVNYILAPARQRSLRPALGNLPPVSAGQTDATSHGRVPDPPSLTPGLRRRRR